MFVVYDKNEVVLTAEKAFLSEFSILLENILSWFVSKGMNEIILTKKDNIFLFKGNNPKIAAFSPVVALSSLVESNYLPLLFTEKDLKKINGRDFIYKNINITLGAETSLIVNQSYEETAILADYIYGLADLLVILLIYSSKIEMKLSAQVSQLVFDKRFTEKDIMEFIDREEVYDLGDTTEIFQ